MQWGSEFRFGLRLPWNYIREAGSTLCFRFGLLANYLSNPHAMGFENAFSLKASSQLHLRSGFETVFKMCFGLGFLCKYAFEPLSKGVRTFVGGWEPKNVGGGSFTRVGRKSKFFVGGVGAKNVMFKDTISLFLFIWCQSISLPEQSKRVTQKVVCDDVFCPTSHAMSVESGCICQFVSNKTSISEITFLFSHVC